MELKSIIKLEQVSKSYRLGETTVQALNNLTLEINPKELTVILGPSGSGKTTLLNMIGGLDTPTLGKILVNGMDISKMNSRELSIYRRNTIGFIFQFFNLIGNLSARENVEFILEYVLEKGNGKTQSRAQDLLEKVGLGDRGNHFPYQLSGGEQQRVAIARALAKNPQILLADEPTGELDYKTGLRILELLLSLVKEGSTVILVTHNSKIADIASKVIKIRDGNIVDIQCNNSPKPVSELFW